MKGLLHINILEDFTTKQKYTHKGNRMLIGSSMLAVHAAFLYSGSFHRGLHRRCMPWERKGTWMKPWRSCESCCAGVRMWIYPTYVKNKKPPSERPGWKSYKCYGQSVLSKIPLWTRKLAFLSACQYLGDITILILLTAIALRTFYLQQTLCSHNESPHQNTVAMTFIMGFTVPL